MPINLREGSPDYIRHIQLFYTHFVVVCNYNVMLLRLIANDLCTEQNETSLSATNLPRFLTLSLIRRLGSHIASFVNP